MTCRNGACKHEFCWVCCGPWKDHSGSFYACNKYDPEKDEDNPDKEKKDSSRAALERYLHYYTRFTNHDNSLKLETEAKLKMENKVKEMEALGTNEWIDCQVLPLICRPSQLRVVVSRRRVLRVRCYAQPACVLHRFRFCVQYLKEANEALHECRYALKFTYVYAFYLPEKLNYRHHFEMQQMELEKQATTLTALFRLCTCSELFK